MTARLALVPPETPAPFDPRAQWRAEVRARDWNRVHIEADKRGPITLGIRRWFYSSPIRRA